MSKDKLLPKLRFKNFVDTEAWQRYLLEELVEVKNGKDYKHLEKGDIPVYGTGGYMTKVNAALSYEKDAIGIGRKGTINKPYILKAPYWTVDTLFYAIPKFDSNINFVQSIFNNINWLSKQESTGVPSLSKATINNIEILIPTIQEQQEIGSFFEKIDQMIQLQQSKVNKVKDIKSAYLSEMFPKEGEKYPKRRFGGFIKPWIQYKLGDLAPLRGGNSFQSNKFVDKGVPIVRISNILTNETVGGSFVFYEEQTDDERFLLPHKSAVLAMSGATTGKVSILNNPNNQKVYQNQRIGYFRDIGVVNYSLISTLVKSLLFDRQLKDVLVAGAQPNVSPKEIDSFVFLIPNDKEEQKKIAEFFENLDNQIAIEEEKLTKLEKLKQAYLNDMFV